MWKNGMKSIRAVPTLIFALSMREATIQSSKDFKGFFIEKNGGL
jgi:hypothetical protein